MGDYLFLDLLVCWVDSLFFFVNFVFFRNSEYVDDFFCLLSFFLDLEDKYVIKFGIKRS